MNDRQLARDLQSVGMVCFVTYYGLFSDFSVPNEEVAARIQEDSNYTSKSCNSRASHARSIIRSGRGNDALHAVVNSNSPRIGNYIRSEAGGLLS